MALQKTNGNVAPPNRVDFHKQDFDDLIAQKGRNVLVEKAIQCPCKGEGTNQQSTCRNCGGTGYAWVNPYTTRMVTQKINLVNDFAPWSEENRGFVNLSYNADEELTYMDKITALDGEAIFNQVLFLKQKGNTVFAYTVYPIKEIKYLAVFIDDVTPYQRLIEGTDYTFQNNVITIINDDIIQDSVQTTNITIRYKHAPVFIFVESKRETMETFEYKDGERLYHMPLSAIARRAHYIPNIENIAGDRLLNNNFQETPNCNNNCNS
jgi:hypothetical protein